MDFLEQNPWAKYALAGAAVTTSLYAIVRRWAAGGKVPKSLLQQSLKGKTVVVTGCNTGIGLETVRILAQLQPERIVMANRDEQKTRDAIASIQHSCPTKLEFIKLDLLSLDSVRSFANELLHVKKYPVDLLINNAGVMMCPYATTKDGFEIEFQTNHLSHFLLTQLLLPSLLERKGRVVNVSSRAAERYTKDVNFDVDLQNSNEGQFTSMEVYGRSKLFNVLFTKELVKRYGPQGLTTYAIHPGVVRTELGRHFGIAFALLKPFAFTFKTPTEGAQTTVFAALCNSNAVPSGSYLADCAVTPLKNPKAYDTEMQSKLWDYSIKWTQQ